MTQLSINTTQNVTINFSAASIGERILACLFDLLIMFVYIMLINWIVFQWFGLDNAISDLDGWSQNAVHLVFFLPVFFYTLFFESICEGQTPGKMLLRIKVVKIDGYQASFGDYLVRWMSRVIDVFLFMGVVGIISIVATGKSQRFGDIAAGTSVITLKNKVTIGQTILMEIDDEYRPVYPMVIKLSDNDARIIKETFQTAQRTADYPMLARLADKIEQVTGVKNQSGNKADFINTVLKDYNYYTQKM